MRSAQRVLCRIFCTIEILGFEVPNCTYMHTVLIYVHSQLTSTNLIRVFNIQTVPSQCTRRRGLDAELTISFVDSSKHLCVRKVIVPPQKLLYISISLITAKCTICHMWYGRAEFFTHNLWMCLCFLPPKFNNSFFCKYTTHVQKKNPYDIYNINLPDCYELISHSVCFFSSRSKNSTN